MVAVSNPMKQAMVALLNETLLSLISTSVPCYIKVIHWLLTFHCNRIAPGLLFSWITFMNNWHFSLLPIYSFVDSSPPASKPCKQPLKHRHLMKSRHSFLYRSKIAGQIAQSGYAYTGICRLFFSGIVGENIVLETIWIVKVLHWLIQF